MRIALMLFGLIVTLTGCYHAGTNEDADLRAVPVTNNPNIVPQRNMGPIQSMPY